MGLGRTYFKAKGGRYCRQGSRMTLDVTGVIATEQHDMTHCRPLSIVGSSASGHTRKCTGRRSGMGGGYAAGVSFLNSDDSVLFGDIGGVVMLMDRG